MNTRICRTILAMILIVGGTVLRSPVASAQLVVERRPNLVAMPASELAIVTDASTGGSKLVFATLSWNNGTGPLEVVAGTSGTAGQDIYQRVYLSDSGFYDHLAGTFEFHPTHNHFHLEGYALYTLQPVAAPGASQRQSEKTSFCLMDTTAINTSLPGAPQAAYYSTCNANLQGISVGWADRYGPTLPGQSFELTNSPSGDYDLRIDIDPEQRLLESNESDNSSCVRLRINVANRTVQNLGNCSAPASVSVSAITPNTLRQGSTATVTISGSGFAAGMAVGFENGSGPAPIAKNIVIVNATTITATVTVKSGGPHRDRFWDVRVGSGVLQRGLRITP